MAQARVVGGGAQMPLVADERVHAVDSHELLGEGVRDAVVVRFAPGMPLTTSLSLIRPKRLWTRSPATPHQLARSALTVVGWLITAGVHSTVWILARSAALTSRARWKSSSSFQDGYAPCRWSQIALCSRANRSCIMARPSQKPGMCEGSREGSEGIGDCSSSHRCSLPSSPVRIRRCAVSFVP